MMLLGPLPRFILLEDAEDLRAFMVATHRTVGTQWCDEYTQAINEGLATGFF